MGNERCRRTLNYGIVEHFFIFMSILFAFILNHSLSRTAHIILNLTKSDSSIIHVIWIILFNLLVLQCWWGTLRTKSVIDNSFVKTSFFIIQPILLYFLSYSLFPEENNISSYSRFFYSNYYTIYLIAFINFAYLYILNKHFVSTEKSAEENLIRKKVFLSFLFISFLGCFFDSFFNKFPIIIELILLFHLVICAIEFIKFINKYRKKIADFEYLNPVGFKEKIKPCILHVLRRNDSFAFILIKTTQQNESLYGYIKDITRGHDEKAIFNNHIFIFQTFANIQNNNDFHNLENIVKKTIKKLDDFSNEEKKFAYKIMSPEQEQYMENKEGKRIFRDDQYIKEVFFAFDNLYESL